MKVVYREPDIYEQFELARAEARKTGQIIDYFRISVEEFEEFVSMAADIDSKSLFAGYTSLKRPDGTVQYWYKNIPIMVSSVKEIE